MLMTLNNLNYLQPLGPDVTHTHTVSHTGFVMFFDVTVRDGCPLATVTTSSPGSHLTLNSSSTSSTRVLLALICGLVAWRSDCGCVALCGRRTVKDSSNDGCDYF